VVHAPFRRAMALPMREAEPCAGGDGRIPLTVCKEEKGIEMAIRTCPHCYAGMQRCIRDGVVMDLCIQCGGIFLDGGELEYLIAASTPDARGEHRHREVDAELLSGRNRYGRKRKRDLLESFIDAEDHRTSVITRRDA
jgi:uncharacterized protein